MFYFTLTDYIIIRSPFANIKYQNCRDISYGVVDGFRERNVFNILPISSGY